MTTLHDDFIAFLKADATVLEAVPGGVYHEFYPQTASSFPVLVLQMITDSEIDLDMEYPDEEAGGTLSEARYQLDIWGQTSKAVVDAQRAIDHVLRGLRGLIGSTRIQQVIRSNRSHLGEIDGDKQRRRVSADYSIWY